MPKTTYQNPLYQGRYNDPNIAGAATNIAALLLGGESPNQAALAASEAALREAQTGSANATSRKTNLESDLLQYQVDDYGNPVGASARILAEEGAMPAEQLPAYRGLLEGRYGGKDGFTKVRRDEADIARMLQVDPSMAPASVSRRRAALGGEALVDASDNRITDKFDQKVPAVVTPIGQSVIGENNAQARSHDANAVQSLAQGRKADAEALAEPIKAAAAASKQDGKAAEAEKGANNVDSIVASLNDYYTQLDEGGGITNPDESVFGNALAGIASSGAGQFTGKLLGTKNQSLRNQIAQQRPLLLQAIKTATGMSSKQMDSNAELKLYLSVATDPTLDVKANRSALDKIVQLYGSGSRAPQPAAPAAWDADKERRYEEWKARRK